MTHPSRISLLDQELLGVLERAFANYADDDGHIDQQKLQRALGLKSEYLARKVLRLFDTDGNGRVDRREFLLNVRAVVFGSEREKLLFAFRLHDDDDDGFLSYTEMLRMISIALSEGDVISRLSQPPERLAAALLKAADTDGDGRISFDEFADIMARHPELLRNMTRSEALWIAPNEELLDRLAGERMQRPSRVQRLFENRTTDGLLLGLWGVINVGLLLWGLFASGELVSPDPFIRAGQALGDCLAFNGALVFVPVLRGFLTWFRRTVLGQRLDVDRAIDFHRWVGQLLFALSVAHSGAYLLAYGKGHPVFGAALVATTYRGATGSLLLLIMAIMWLFAQDFVRRGRRFELFYFSHLLYVVWLALLIVHAPSFLGWGAVPVAGLLFELWARGRRRKPRTHAISVTPLRSGVVRLDLERPAKFTFEPGDYLFLNVPHIAKYEWHPFTISSAPEKDELSVHVRSLGNWSSALRVDAEEREARGDASYPVRIDGPYGTPSAKIFRAKNAVLIGAGIGVTPFASVLESISMRGQGLSARPSNLEHVHFFWLNRDQYSFEWFQSLLARLEEDDNRDLIDIHVCMTGGRTGATAAGLEVAREILQAETQRDVVTGLRGKTHMGHPDWNLVLSTIAEQHEAGSVDVFFCGPVGLGRKLEKLCTRYGLRFHEEKF